MGKATVNILCNGKGWIFQLVSGSLDHVPNNLYISTGQQLVNACNKYEITVQNKMSILEELAIKLKY